MCWVMGVWMNHCRVGMGCVDESLCVGMVVCG